MSLPQTKPELREYFRAKRYALSKAEREAHARLIAGQFSADETFQNKSPMAAYVATHHEADPIHIIEHVFSKGVGIALPKSTEKKDIIFCEWNLGDVLHEGSFSIPEPEYTDPVIPEIILIPLLAYDAKGHRLGYGGGYYDRTLLKPAYKKSICIGVAYAFQRTERLPHEAHDVRLHAVITEEGVEWFR